MKVFFESVLAKIGSAIISDEATRDRTTARRFTALTLVVIAYTSIVFLLPRQF